MSDPRRRPVGVNAAADITAGCELGRVRSSSGRRGKWSPAITPEVRNLAAVLNGSIRTRLEPQDRVLGMYRLFVDHNRLDVWTADSVVLFTASLQVSLKASTVDNYLGLLQAAYRRMQQTGPTTAFSEVKRITRLKRADEPALHAVDISTAEAYRKASALLERGEIDDVEHAFMLGVLIMGLRGMDLKRLRSCQCAFDPDEGRLSFDVRVTKGIRSARSRRRVQLQKELEVFPVEALDALFEVLIGHDEAKPFDDVSTARLSRLLKPHSVASLRRNYIHRRIAEYTDANGIVDYASVQQKTSHLTADTLQAFYVADL